MVAETVPLPEPRCPTCRRNSLTLTEFVENVDYFGPVLLTTISCTQCGYRDADVASLSEGKPSIIRAQITSTRDLTMKVIRSSSATIHIPRLGISISPVSSAEGFITNVEGVLDRIQPILEGVVPNLSARQKKRAEAILADLKKAREGHLSFILELRDPSGNSAIAGSNTSKIKKKPFPKKELERYKKQLMSVQPGD